MVSVELMACQDHRETRDQREQRVSPDLQVSQELRENRARQVTYCHCYMLKGEGVTTRVYIKT